MLSFDLTQLQKQTLITSQILNTTFNLMSPSNDKFAGFSQNPSLQFNLESFQPTPMKTMTCTSAITRLPVPVPGFLFQVKTKRGAEISSPA